MLASSDELGDIFIMNGDQTVPLGSSGKLLDVTDDLKADPKWRDLQIPGGMVEWTYKGRNYGVGAQMIITHVVYWNKDIFDKVGIKEWPATWDAFKDAITKIKAAGYTPIALGSKAGWPLYDCAWGVLVFRIAGVDWYNNLVAHKAAFTDPEFITVLKTFKEMVDMGAFNADATSLDNAQARTLYYNKKAAMFVEGNWAIGAGGISTEAPEDVRKATQIALYPAVTGGKGGADETTWAAGWGWGLNSKLTGAKREAAISLLKALSGTDFGRMRVEGADLPAQIITEFDKTKLPPLFVTLNEKSLKWKAVPIFVLGLPTSTTDVLWKGLHEIITGQATPEEVAKKIQTDFDKYKE